MHHISVTIDHQAYEIELPAASGENRGCVLARIRPQARQEHPAAPFETVELCWQPMADGGEWYLVNQRPYEVLLDPESRSLRDRRRLYALEVRDLQAHFARPVSRDGRVKSPIPGVITRLFVKAGDAVAANQPLLILEAMKMQNEIRAPRSGVVSAVYVQPGDSVPIREVLVEIK
jgi:biotin carboxyl carrier protein